MAKQAPKTETPASGVTSPVVPVEPENRTAPASGEGLWLIGTLTSRTRRQVTLTKSNKTRWVVTLCVLADNQVYHLDRWCDSPSPADCPKVGQSVSLQLRQRIFTATNGQTRVSLEWGPRSTEDEF
jgi:hypothetical protein